MKKICAWCKKDLGGISSDQASEQLISHGMCAECANHFRAQMGVDIQRFLDGLNEPILIVDSDSVVLTANLKARNFLQKELIHIEGFKGGDVFECEYAMLPGGCGNTIHCSGCTIRMNVMDTFTSGKSHLETPAFLNHKTAGTLSFLISTEKIGDVVLLRIDKVMSD